MAKRKRLTPAVFLEEGEAVSSRPVAGPPIARVSGEAALAGALDEVAGELRAAREEGRLILKLPLAAIRRDHLVRDRIPSDDEEMQALIASIRARGQQVPIEVSEIEGGQGAYGLISGWRRLEALSRLAEEDAERFGSVLALVKAPADAPEAYLAMIEENEIRVGLSFYERARIVMRSVQERVYPSQREALLGLFPTASPAKRSKIKSFIPLVEGLDSALRFPTRISERLGLELAKRMAEDPAFAARLSERLQREAPADGDAEMALLTKAATQAVPRGAKPAAEKPQELVPGVRLSRKGKGIALEGKRVDAAFEKKLSRWIRDEFG
ncbi:ParB-like nuclease domain protein [Pseudoruegeria aquimaris]|uniref:ParB-like nuclease domain protein n=1 Tax=Pseudoruegeria aquimaris TaxID=393663 RepID=A0A1Y5TT84_9RHOB|nr:ParB N-terminal domain-containing protein [Pseudoruegeria aquimaris]SLN67731.1 ParB-like nuclease domain protein [Pseudoruegeria aquimaris]